MNRRQKILYKRVLSVFVPVLILFVLGVFGTNAYFAYPMLHPKRRAVLNTPHGYEQLLQKPIWDNKTWTGGDGTQMTGWLLSRTIRRLIILSHGYGANREELLGPSFELWDAGYNVIAYDLRGARREPCRDVHARPGRARRPEGDDPVREGAHERRAAPPLRRANRASTGSTWGLRLALCGGRRTRTSRPSPSTRSTRRRWTTSSTMTKRMIGSTDPPDTSFVENALMQSTISMFMGVMAGGGTPPMDAGKRSGSSATGPSS